MKKLILLCGLCVFALNVFSADDPVAQLNAIYAKGKTEYAKLAKQIETLKTGNRLNAKTEIATAEKKQQAIVDQIKAVQTAGNLSAQQRQAVIIAELKKGRELSKYEEDTIKQNLAHEEYVKNLKK